MIDKISSLCVQKLLDEKMIDFDTMDIYLFGFQLLFASIFKLLGFLIIGLALGVFWELFLFLIAFSTLRLNAGGFHSTSYYKCFLVSLSFSLIGLKASAFAYENFDFYYLFIILVMTLFLVFKYAPVESSNKPLSSQEKIKYKKSSRAYVTIISLILLVFYFIKTEWILYYYIFSMGFFIESLTLINFSRLIPQKNF